MSDQKHKRYTRPVGPHLHRAAGGDRCRAGPRLQSSVGLAARAGSVPRWRQTRFASGRAPAVKLRSLSVKIV